MAERLTGTGAAMPDAVERVVGTVRFTVDERVDGMLEAACLRSPHPHARIVAIDTAAALDAPGVRAVVTGADLKAREGFDPYFGLARADQPAIAIDKVRYAGEPVAVVVAETEAQAREATWLIDVDYEPLEAILDARAARKPGAPLVHDGWPENHCGVWRLRRGDVDAALAEADLVHVSEYCSPPASTVPFEPNVAVATWHGDRLDVWTATQWPSGVQRELARMFGLPEEQVRVRTRTLGGGYGAKGQVKIEPLVAAVAQVAGAPVRLELTREEVFLTVSKHACWIRLETGVRADGTFLARRGEVVYDAGAYAVTSPTSSGQGLVRAPGPYHFPNIEMTSEARYTNTVPAGSFRGAMTSQVAFAYESHSDEIAVKLGIDPVELRRRNLMRDGDVYATGETFHDVHFVELLDDVAAAIGWEQPSTPPAAHRARGKGVGVILKSTPTPSRSEARLRLDADGTVTAFTSTAEMGQGAHGTFITLVADALDLPPERVRAVHPDTDRTPFDSMTAGSRATSSMGTALGHASVALKNQLTELAARQLEVDPADLHHVDGTVAVVGDAASGKPYRAILRDAGFTELTTEGLFQSEGSAFADPDDVRGQASVHWHQGAAAVEVEVDLETGRVEILRARGAAWAGRVISPTRVRLQNDGGLIWGIGPALFEQLEYDDGRLMNPNMAEYLIPSFRDVPVDLASDALESDDDAEVHGVGEMTLPAVAPAIANAVERACGVRIRELPLTPERVLRALDAQSEAELGMRGA